MRHVPQRSCIGCRKVRARQELVRVVHTAEDRFELDIRARLPGRGAYLCPSPECLSAAVKRKGFDRSFRRSVPREAVASLEQQIREFLSLRTEDPAQASCGG